MFQKKKRLIFLLALFLAFFCLTSNILKTTAGDFLAEKFQLGIGKFDSSDILQFISAIASALLAFIGNLFISYWEKHRILQEEAPYITIVANGEKSVTGIKKQVQQNGQEVVLGTPQARFRYVYAKIKNTGKGTIIKCLIADQELPCIFDPKAEHPICFRLYESPENEQESQRTETFSYQIEDGRGNTYIGSFRLQIDLEKNRAFFYTKKRQRKV